MGVAATVGAIAASVAAASAVAGTAYAISGAGTPSAPNLGAASRKISNTEAAMLPYERMLEAAAQSGTAINFSTPQQQQQLARLQSQLTRLQNTPATATPTIGHSYGMTLEKANAERQNQIANLQSQISKLSAGTSADFTGNGAGEIQGKVADQNAANQLALEQKYSPQFIAESLKEEALADPQSVAARDRESQLIQQQINQPVTNPVAPMLENQIDSRVNAGKGLDDFDAAALNNGVAQALAARGGGGGAGTDFTSPLTTGLAGDQRQIAGIGQAQSFMGSGTTPEDVKYRQDQQNLANLSAEISGQTPTSEFSSLSNASHSANPVANGQPLSTVGNSLQTGGNAALTQYGQQANQANSWMSGLSGVLNASTAIANVAKA